MRSLIALRRLQILLLNPHLSLCLNPNLNLSRNRSSNMSRSELIRAAVVGFARTDCKKCFGRGRIGFDAKYKDMLHVMVCPCVELMDLETVRASLDKQPEPPAQTETADVQK